MSKLTITIEMDGAAFEGYDDLNQGPEVARILSRFINGIEMVLDLSYLSDGRPMIDSNGNRCGKVEVER